MNRVDDPRPGFYKMRLVRGGPWVAVMIWVDDPTDELTGEPLDRPPMLRALVDEVERDPYEVWTSCAGRPIPHEEYVYLLEMRHYATEHRPDLPDAAPRDPVDWQRVRVFKE